jgi:hypothetical protein
LKLLLNNKEIVHYLQTLINYKEKVIERGFETINHVFLDLYVSGLTQKMLKKPQNRKKLKDGIRKSITKDLRLWFDNINTTLDEFKSKDFELLHTHIEQSIERLGEDTILENYKKSSKTNFVKSTGLNIDPDAEFIRRKNFNDYDADCLIRNTVGNEDLLIQKIDNQYPFWFIDSGYTNFLEPNKKWHRLVRNHLHYGNYFDAPVDRLGNFKEFPRQWREDGETILVIEPGPFAAGIFHVDLKTWKYEIEKELRKFTDKKIKFREKAPKKERTPLFKELLEEDYYCLININSNAATEAIWAGVPAITLDKHITNFVSRNKISDINNLYKGSLGNWLAMLSYSQFTYEELITGKAYEIFLKYHV